MQVTLGPQEGALVQRRVATGRYSSPSEVVREALALLGDFERYEAFRAAVMVGHEEAERGEVALWTPELRAALGREAQE